ncbi:MAG: DMT family transporter [Thermodesulfobacteriota bacterium]
MSAIASKKELIVKGYLQMLCSSLAFALMVYFAKIAITEIPGPEITFFRFTIGLALVLGLSALGKVNLHATRKGLLVARSIMGGLAVLLLFMALTHGKMTNVTVLNSTHPLFAMIAAGLFLHERIHLVAVMSMAVSLLGIVLLINPDFNYVNLSDLLALASGMLAGLIMVTIREMRVSGESTWTILFYFTICGSIISLTISIPMWVWPSLRAGLNLLLVAGLSFIAQVTMTSSYKYCNVSVGGILSMTTIVFSAMIGYLVLGEKLTFSETLGGVLIVGGNVGILWFENRGNHRGQRIAS